MTTTSAALYRLLGGNLQNPDHGPDLRPKAQAIAFLFPIDTVLHVPRLLPILLLSLALSACHTPSASSSRVAPGALSIEDLYADLPFDMPRVVEPQFPAFEVSLVDFDAVGDGSTPNTQAFARAIAEVAGRGGGTLRIPRGIWLTGPITLRSNVRIHTEEGAVVLFSRDQDDYPLVSSSFEGL